MLVLSRKKDESIVINNDITIVVIEIRGDKVRLGVEAPKEVPVHRREVFDAIVRGEPVTPRPDSVSNHVSADTRADARVVARDDIQTACVLPPVLDSGGGHSGVAEAQPSLKAPLPVADE
jgi:carbon storage regulator